MCKTNTRKRVALLLAVLLAVAIFAAPAEASGVPSKIIVFTDKKVYTAWWVDSPQSGAGVDFVGYDPDFGDVYVYATVLDVDGKIMKGRTITGNLYDTVEYDHEQKANPNVHHANLTDPNLYDRSLIFNDTGTFGDGVAGDGIYTAKTTLSSSSLGLAAGNARNENHIKLRAYANDTAGGLSGNTEALISSLLCMNGFSGNMGGTHAKWTPGGMDNCAVCHIGYEHFYENKSGTFADSQLDIHALKWNPADVTPTDTCGKGFEAWVWNRSGPWDAGGASCTENWETQVPGSKYCFRCHIYGNALYDYDSSQSSGATTRNNLSDKPSCNNANCHSTTDIEGVAVIPWTQAGAVSGAGQSNSNIWKQKSHNHTTTSTANVSCALCHLTQHGFSRPSNSTTNVTQICLTCHNRSDGWINVSKNVSHTSTGECKNCHLDNNQLDSHLVPTGVFGGKWCMDCHKILGKSPIDMDENVTNVSNTNYIHYELNNKSQGTTNSSRICWGCHTNDSVVVNGIVNSTKLPESTHPDKYNQPRNCTSCHNSTASTNFSAPQTYRHTWYAANMKTTAVTYCTNCHGQDEMALGYNQSATTPSTDNESASHYGKVRTDLEEKIGSREYCGYCHQNETTVMGPFANPDNEVRSDHASQATTPGCGNNTCHKPGRMHENTLIVPAFTEANIGTTCQACHSSGSYSSHNSTVTCWDCHMGNVSSTIATWVHPIQFIQYNGNFTGAKLTGTTCYDCHKSTSVDSTITNLSGKSPPKVYNQAHSSDPNNGTKWGDYWKYTPTTYEFASYEILGGNGSIDPLHPFANIQVPSNDYMQLNETQTGRMYDVTLPAPSNDRDFTSIPSGNWTSSTATGGVTGTVSASYDSTTGNPAGSLKGSLTTSSTTGQHFGYIWWNYSFNYNPNSSQYKYTNASVDYSVTVASATYAQNVYLNIVKPSGAVVTLASSGPITANTGWLTLSNYSFASALNENGSITPYKLQLYAVLSGPKTSQVFTVNYDNVNLRIKEKVWNRYEMVINTTSVPVNGSSKLGMSYQVHRENTSLMIYNKTSFAYELLDTLDKGVFYDYTKNISTHHINSTNGVTGNVSVKFADDDQSDTDATTDAMHIRYLYIYTDRGLQYPCEQCHSPNKHYIFPTIGSPDKFKANNAYDQAISSTSTWCQQCHWQGAANYSKMIQEFNVTRNPPENIPPEITGNATYGNYTKYGGKSKDGSTDYYNHSGLAMDDQSCFSCHGAAGDTTTSQFVHNVQVGTSGGRNCTSCHDVNGDKKKVNFTSMNKSMHGKLNSGATSTAQNASNKPCWGCHGTRNGTWANETDQPLDNHNTTVYKAPRKCQNCHITGSLQFTTKNVTDHIPSGYTSSTDVNTSSYNYAYCANCHNNSIGASSDPDGLGLSTGGSPANASVSHYGANRTAGKLMNATRNSTDCNYCHRNSSNMAAWGIQQGSLANISNKNASGGGTDHSTYTSSGDCSQCHGGYAVTAGFTFHNAALGNGSGGGSGPNCKSCHDIGGSQTGKLVNFSAMNETNAIHKNLNSGAVTALDAENKKCWACHGDGSEPPVHPSNYKTPYNCTYCHSTGGSQSGKYPGWNVTEHVKAGTVSGTEILTPQAESCYACHNRSEMMLYANDPDSGTGAVYSGANGGNNSTSHYGKKRSLGSNDAYCNYCHNNASSPFYLSAGNKSIIEHTANTTANISNSTTLECADCHSTGRIHNDTLAKPAVQAWTSGRQDYCAPCHRAGNASSTKYVYGHNSSNISSISIDCGYCHNASSQGQVSTGKLRIHTSSLSNKSTANTTCASCHQDSNYVTNQRVVYTHYPGAPAGRANTTLDSFTCEACHGNMAANKMHAPVSIPVDRCNNCHNSTTSGSFKATKVPYVDITKHDNASHNASNSINCNWCHNNSNAIQKFHFTQYPNGSVQAPGWSGWVNGTNANCTNCHDTYNQTKPFYAEPIWHKGNYGTNPDNCYQCHTNVSSNTSSYAPVALHNVTKAIDWSYCTNCHSNNYGGAPVVDNASLANSMHYSLNGSTPSNIEPACKACHGGNSTVHKNSIANNCTYCHITGNTKFGAKNVSRHIPYPLTINVNTSRYQNVFCSDCHNNSLGTFNDPTPNSSNATTAHYGMNKTGGKLMYNISGNSEDCVYCHRNNSNMAAWGILSTSNANLSKKGASHATASDSDCYTCHVNSTATPATFHIEDISAGAGGGPDCKACHDIGGNAQGKLVNFSAMNATGAIHKNLNKDRTPDTTSSAENRKCWACHTTNGTAPQAGNHTLVNRYKNPYNCTDCHITKSGQNFNYTPSAVLNVTQHKADTVNGTTIFTPSAQDCYSCHNISEMMIPAYDPDGGTGAVYGGLHGGNDSVSHYGLTRSLGAGDSYCNYCHRNSSSAFLFTNDHNKSIIEHTATAVNISNSTTLECIDCHRNGRIHDASLNKTPQSAWTSGQKDFCAPCHKPKPTGSANKSVYQQGHDPVNSSGDRIGDCGYCHNASSQGINGSYLNVHSETLTNRSTTVNSSTCQGCHNLTTLYVGAAKQILSHMPNASQYRGNTSTSGYACEYCHNLSGKPSMHSTGMTRSNGTCETCHLNSTSPYNSTKKNITQLAGMLNHNYNGSANTTCKMCHNASGRAKFHLSKYAYGDVADPQNSSGYSTFEPRGALLVDCRDCHETYNDTEPFDAPYFEANRTGVNLQEHKGKGYTLNNCYVCHTYEDNVSKVVTLHNVSIEPLSGGPNCKKCHDIASPNRTGDSKMWVNFTAFNGTNSKHRNLTNATAWGGSALFTLIDTACWACHQSDGKQMERHPDLKDDTTSTGGYKAYRCADCHTTAGIVSSKQPKIYQNATKVYRHYPGAVFSGNKAFPAALNCSMCHKNSRVVDINLSGYSDNIDAMTANVSHYATRIDLIDTRNSSSTYGCNECHEAGVTRDNYGNAAKIILPNHNLMGSSPARCQKSCHNSNPSINITLHDANAGIYIGTSGCYSSGCHTLPSTGGRKRR